MMVATRTAPPAGHEVMRVSYYESPLGRYLIAASAKGIVCVKPHDQRTRSAEAWQRGVEAVEGENQHIALARAELEAYFAGDLRDFTVVLDMRGSAFQLAAWEALCKVPYGETRTYGQQAATLGKPNASRAVGLANGSNPVSIIVPCHRIIGSTGKLTGYGGGLDRKRALLDLEMAVRDGKQANLF